MHPYPYPVEDSIFHVFSDMQSDSLEILHGGIPARQIIQFPFHKVLSRWFDIEPYCSFLHVIGIMSSSSMFAPSMLPAC